MLQLYATGTACKHFLQWEWASWCLPQILYTLMLPCHYWWTLYFIYVFPPRCGCSRVPSPPRSLWRVIGCLGSCNKSVTVIWNFQFSVNIDSWCHKILNIPSIAASVSTSPGETVVIVKNNSSLKTVKYISLAPDLEDWFASWLL